MIMFIKFYLIKLMFFEKKRMFEEYFSFKSLSSKLHYNFKIECLYIFEEKIILNGFSGKNYIKISYITQLFLSIDLKYFFFYKVFNFFLENYIFIEFS